MDRLLNHLTLTGSMAAAVRGSDMHELDIYIFFPF
jgi:hypothetical protein